VNSFKVRLQFHGDLNVFVRSKSRDAVIERRLAEKTSIKDVIESCGIPHPEVDLILLDDQAVGFDQTVADAAKADVFPVEKRDANHTEKRLQTTHLSRFVADRHLCGLTRNLRLLGLMSPTQQTLMTNNCSRLWPAKIERS
jgi:hypothetical protein